MSPSNPMSTSASRSASVRSLPRRVLSERMARGALINLVGAVTYGLSGFVFITLLAREIGPVGAGTFWLALAAFNIVSRSCELGAVSGFVKLIARHRSVGDGDRIAPTIVAGLIPVIAVGLLGMNALAWFAPVFAGLVGGSDPGGDVGDVVGALSVFLPVNAVYWVVAQGMRGFGTMLPTVLIDRIGRAVLQPVAVLVVLGRGGDLAAAARAWGLVVVALLVVAATTMVVKLQRVLWAEGRVLTLAGARPDDDVVREFWGFTLPRAGGQVFEVMILWIDVLLVGVFVSAADAGVYAAASRFALIGTFVGEAIMQVVGARTAELLAHDDRASVTRMLDRAATAQTLLVWPAYVVVVVNAPILMSLFGEGFEGGATALRLLSVGLVAAALLGPVSSVLLMSGHSRVAFRNTALALTTNIVANLVLIPVWGAEGAASAWALTFVVASGLAARACHTVVGVEIRLGRRVRLAGASTILGLVLAGLARLIFGLFGLG